MKRTFVIGDIHGCFDELLELTDKVGLKDSDLLISVGDIVDRGNKSKDVYQYFVTRLNSKVLIGNHERKHINGVLSYAQEIVKVQFKQDYQSFLTWLQTLDYYYEIEEAIIVHAAFEHDKLLKDQKDEVLCGSTSGERYLEKKYQPDTFWSNYYQGEKPIIYGHHVVGSSPKIINNTYGIDTGACHGGYLTAIELPGFKIHQVRAKKDYWKEEQKLWQIPVLKSKYWGNMEMTAIKKQLAKLSFVEQPDVKELLNLIEKWVFDLEELLQVIKSKLDLFTQDIVNNNKETFSLEANKHNFKTFLFKSKSNNLKIDDLRKSLETPNKIISLAKELKISNIPAF